MPISRPRIVTLMAGLLLILGGLAGQEARNTDDLGGVLEPIRQKHGLPALAGAIVTGEGLAAVGATGTRKAGEDIPVTRDDLWHLGSNTKAMTSALIAALVEEGTLRWETRLEEIFPEAAAGMPEGLKKVTLLHLLSHRSGLQGNLLWPALPRTGPLVEQRLAVIPMAAKLKLVSDPGAEFLYSNLGYVVAGAAAEKAGGKSWEDLLRDKITGPLGMTTLGFGGLGTPGETDQPWPHGPNGRPLPRNGPDVDNPAVMGPAGTGHCTLADWAKFIADLLRGARGERALLKPETYEKLLTPPFGGDYALGWKVVDRPWGGGKVLTHNGSNSMNYATAWVAPLMDFAVLAVTNQGGDAAAKACDEAAAVLIKKHAERSKG